MLKGLGNINKAQRNVQNANNLTRLDPVDIQLWLVGLVAITLAAGTVVYVCWVF